VGGGTHKLCYHDKVLYKEFKSQVEAQGVKLPPGWGGAGGDRYPRFANLGFPGSGQKRNFSNFDIRLAVSWVRVHNLVGSVSTSYQMAQDATNLLAIEDHGWVVMSEGQVWWEEQPGVQVFDKGAVCLKVK